MASRLIRNQLPARVAGSTPVSSAFLGSIHSILAVSMFGWKHQHSLGILCIGLSVLSAICAAQDDEPIQVGPKEQLVATPQEIAQARSELLRANEDYLRRRRLAARGSVSPASLEKSKLDRDVAALTLRALENPEAANEARLEVAKKRLELARADFEKSKKLFARGSVSSLRHRRAQYRFKHAELVYKAAAGQYSTQDAKLLIAKSKLTLAEVELQLGRQLFQRRSISRPTYQALLDRVRQAKDVQMELEQLKTKQQKVIKDRRGT